jgi:hypothetical protein
MASARDPREVPETTIRSVVRNKLLTEDRCFFVESISRDLRSIEEFCRQHDEAALLMRIHSLRGALLVIGEDLAADDCAMAEKYVHAQGLEEAWHHVEWLMQSLRRLVELHGKD